MKLDKGRMYKMTDKIDLIKITIALREKLLKSEKRVFELERDMQELITDFNFLWNFIVNEMKDE